jgi:methylated-DNA-[protein]-cysteine S-methyltransferase
MTEISTPTYVAQSRIDTPLGPLAAVATARGLAGLWFDAQSHHPGVLDAPRNDEHPWLQATARGLAAYWRGEEAPFEVPLDLHGTAFQRAVWQALLRIGRGCTRTYGEIAALAGSPAAVRAAGAAIGRNPVSIIVPCHRVIGRDGSLTGYAGGLERKLALLQLEGVWLA